jgi:hypothetical protein
MSLINVVLWVGGVVLIVVGVQRARGPWSRYQALKEEDANAERYAAWRGGVRGAGETTGASVAMQILQRQARIGAAIAIVGLVLVFLGFLIK